MKQTFTVTIHNILNGEWQGTVAEEKDGEQRFENIFELLRAIDAKLQNSK